MSKQTSHRPIPRRRTLLTGLLLAACSLGSASLSATPQSAAPAASVDKTSPHWMVSVGRLPLTSRDLLPPLLELFDGVVLAPLDSLAEQDSALVAPHLEKALAVDPRQRWIFLSLDDGQQLAIVLRATAPDLLTGARQLATEVRSLRRAGASFVGYKLDVGVRLFPRPGQSQRSNATMDRSLFALGIAEQKPSARFVFLPEELVTRTLIDSQRRLRLSNLRKMDIWTASERQELETFLDSSRLDLFHLDLHSRYSDGSRHWPLYRGHRRFNDDGAGDMNPAALLEAARQGADYLNRQLDTSGRFVYAYLPKTDEEKSSYNILRHAGTTYSLLEVHEATDDPVYLQAAERALAFLRRQIEDCATDAQWACVVEDGEVKLGGNALAMLAFEKHIQLTGQTTDLALLERLGGYVLSEQATSGEFLVHKRSHPQGTASSFVSQYYPGEALLALARHPQAKDSWLDAAAQGARWLITVRDGDLDNSQLAHDHWLLYALADIHAQRPDLLFIDHAAKIVSVIVKGQNRKPAYPDWHGSFYLPPRSTPTATRAEGLGAAYPLLQQGGRGQEAQQAFEAMVAAVRFQLSTQFDAVSSLYVPQRHRVFGGFRRSLENFEIRIDYVQHNISALLALRRLLLRAPAGAADAVSFGDTAPPHMTAAQPTAVAQ